MSRHKGRAALTGLAFTEKPVRQDGCAAARSAGPGGCA
jgi:hypothetical protein